MVEVGWCRGDETWARGAEELLEDWERLWTTTLELQKLVTILLTEGGVDSVIKAGGMEGNANGDESVHLVVHLGNGVVLRVLLEVLGTRDVDEDVAEHADGVCVAAHHHVGETDIVVGCEVCSHNTRKHGLLVKLNIIEGLERETEVAQKAVYAQQANDREVAQHSVDGLGAVVTGNSHGLLVALHGAELLVDLRSLDERVKDVEHAVASPSVGILPQDLDLLIIVGLARNLVAVRTEGVELVDELVNHVPGPVVLPWSLVRLMVQPHSEVPYTWGLKVHRSIRVQNEVEQAAVIVVTRKLDLQWRREVERLCSSEKSGLNIVARVANHAIILGAVVLDLFPVVGDQGILLDIRVRLAVSVGLSTHLGL